MSLPGTSTPMPRRFGTTYVITGGAPLHTYAHPDAYYHYVQVIVQGEQVETRVVRLE